MKIENEVRMVDELAVLDLDRTLIDSSAVAQLVLAGLASQNVPEEKIRQAMDYMESQTGNSFHLFDYITREFGENVTTGVADSLWADDLLLDELRNDLLCPGADRLIEGLIVQSVPHLILTYGEERYQEFKIQLFRKLIGKTELELPAIITTTPNKSDWVTKAWFNAEDIGVIPAEIFGERLHIRRAFVIDDKRQNLISQHPNVQGILIDNFSAQVPSAITIAQVADALRSGVMLMEVVESVKKGQIDR